MALLARRQREAFGFAVGDLVDHELGDNLIGRRGRGLAVLNYGRVITVQWQTGEAANHTANYLRPHVEGA